MPPTLLKQPQVTLGAAPVRLAHIAAVLAVLGTMAWFTLPVAYGHYNEGFQSVVVMNAMAILYGGINEVDLLYPMVNDFFMASRLGASLVLAGLLKLGLPAVTAFRLLMLVSLIVLVAANAVLLVRRYGVHPVLACLPALLFAGLFESAWFFNDNVLSAALSTTAIVLFWTRPTLGVTAISAVLWGLAITCRTDAVLLAPAFAVLLWFELPTWNARIRHALVAGVIVAVVPVLVYASVGLNVLDVLTLTKRATVAWARKDPLYRMLHPVLKALAPPGLLAVAIGAVVIIARRQWREVLLCLVAPLVYFAVYGRMLTEVRYLLPLTPFFGILMVEGARAVLNAAPRLRTFGVAAFAAAFAACFLPPVMLPNERLWFLSTDNDMPRPSVGRFWSPVLSMWWNGKLQDGYEALTAGLAAAAAPGGVGIVASTRWTPDHNVDLILREQGFTGVRATTPASCAELGEVFTRGDARILHLRPHIPFLPTERAQLTWQVLGMPCLRDMGLTDKSRVLVAGQMLIREPAPGISAPGVEALYVTTLDINPWARFIAGKSYGYFVATAPMGAIAGLMPAPLTELEWVGAEWAIENRHVVQ